MRRIVIVAPLVAVGVVVARACLAKLHERLFARCEAMFARIPDAFPPRKMMGGIDEIRVKTGRILELLETRPDKAAAPERSGSSTEAVHHAA